MSDERPQETTDWPLDVVKGEPGEMIVWFDEKTGDVTLNLLDLGGRPLVSICVYGQTLGEALAVRATLAEADLPFVTVMFCNHRLTDAGKIPDRDQRETQ